MKVIFKNSDLIFQTYSPSGWVDVTNTIATDLSSSSFVDTSGVVHDNLNNFYITEVPKGNATKVEFTGVVSNILGIISFRDANDDVVGTVYTASSLNITLDSNNRGKGEGCQVDFPAGATKVWLCYAGHAALSPYTDCKAQFKVRLYYPSN